MIANMDTTGTFSIAAAASKHKIITCIHKHYTPNEWGAFAEANEGTLEYVAASAGSSGEFQRKYSWFNTIDFGLKPPPPPPPPLPPSLRLRQASGDPNRPPSDSLHLPRRGQRLLRVLHRVRTQR